MPNVLKSSRIHIVFFLTCNTVHKAYNFLKNPRGCRMSTLHVLFSFIFDGVYPMSISIENSAKPYIISNIHCIYTIPDECFRSRLNA